MDHPVYDVWVLDCLQEKGTVSEEMKAEEEARGEGEQDEDAVPAQPGMTKPEIEDKEHTDESAVEQEEPSESSITNDDDDEILIERLND